MNTKHELREFMKKEVLALRGAEMARQSSFVNEQLIRFIRQRNSGVVMLYAATKREVNIDATIERCRDQWIVVLLPKVIWPSVQAWVEITNWEECVLWAYRVREPLSTEVFHWPIDLIVVPGLAFDIGWNRIGKWPWYYDRFLAQYPECYKVGVCFNEQFVDNVPVEAHDIPMEKVLFASSWF